MWVTGAALFIRLADYREVGGLDDHFLLTWKKLTCVGVCAAGEKACLYSAKCGISRRRGYVEKRNPRKTFLNFRNNLLMLYKNLPDKELEHVLFIRGILDRVAALVFI